MFRSLVFVAILFVAFLGLFGRDRQHEAETTNDGNAPPPMPEDEMALFVG